MEDDIDQLVQSQIDGLSVALFDALHADPALSSLTAVHWMLVRRACFYYAVASLTSDPQSDRTMKTLLEEPLRHVRMTEVLQERIEDAVIAAVSKAVPDPALRLRIAEALSSK